MNSPGVIRTNSSGTSLASVVINEPLCCAGEVSALEPIASPMQTTAMIFISGILTPAIESATQKENKYHAL